MVQGTGSDVGKSLIVAGLCRLFANRGRTVRPFKPQNMSNNAAVTDDGGEIGRAQALQAQAARQPLSVHMNPVLLKPQTEIGAQVVVQGKVRGNAKARDYHAMKPELLAAVLDSFAVMRDGADLVIVEGAGSPAEVNLRAGDIANMGFALAAKVPVVLVADIDRGGVIASLVGTWELMTDDERACVRGYVINKFRGDVTLFDDAIRIIKDRTGMRCFGVVPHFAPARLLPAEDAVALDAGAGQQQTAPDRIRIAVPRLPRIANFDDLDPLNAEDGVEVVIVEAGAVIPVDTDVILIPGSKATLSDLAALRAEGWDIDILAHHRRGGVVVGLCGGYQMLGQTVADPDGVEGAAAAVPGLGLLEVDTVIGAAKTLRPAAGRDTVFDQAITGYEMHMGETTGAGLVRPWLVLADGTDGAVSACGRVMGAYVHGLFAADDFRAAFLGAVRAGDYAAASHAARVEETLDALAKHLETHLDMDGLDAAFA
ncbi:MAG TPA: cobyric acid synthase CobQ [Rhodospirillaceae bacterium]|nr:cobyric acid synthase CobQ [Magnetovibrio sp.]HCS71527.1 cobyric acid synthase CobQ [Rhodospirillaceae bacterium]|tara:strand:- start:5985 stop:7436 length:1452 start_codon:yes stop_codon:yes gene_type:complete